MPLWPCKRHMRTILHFNCLNEAVKVLFQVRQGQLGLASAWLCSFELSQRGSSCSTALVKLVRRLTSTQPFKESDSYVDCVVPTDSRCCSGVRSLEGWQSTSLMALWPSFKAAQHRQA